MILQERGGGGIIVTILYGTRGAGGSEKVKYVVTSLMDSPLRGNKVNFSNESISKMRGKN